MDTILRTFLQTNSVCVNFICSREEKNLHRQLFSANWNETLNVFPLIPARSRVEVFNQGTRVGNIEKRFAKDVSRMLDANPF